MDHVAIGEARISVLALPDHAAAPPFVDAFVERFVLEPTGVGPLCGTTFAVKDLFNVAGRIAGCGNPFWRATHAPAHTTAPVIARLLSAGARLLGTTRTDELAYSLDGRNFFEGAPLNSAAPTRLTGGSSSGSASAVAAAEVDFAIGTDTAGSVRVPAAWCGLIGLRPTHGRVTVAGLAPLAPSFDTVAWLARSGTLMQRVGAVLFETNAAGLSVDKMVHDPAVDALACNLRYPGAPRHSMRDISLGLDLERTAECLRVLQGAEVWRTHGAWIDATAPRFGPGVAERFERARSISNDQLRWAEQEQATVVAILDAALPRGALLCLPAVPEPAALRDAPYTELHSRRIRLFQLTSLASLTGRPQLSLPTAAADAPTGISFLGWRGGDEALLQLAAELHP